MLDSQSAGGGVFHSGGRVCLEGCGPQGQDRPRAALTTKRLKYGLIARFLTQTQASRFGAGLCRDLKSNMSQRNDIEPHLKVAGSKLCSAKDP